MSYVVVVVLVGGLSGVSGLVVVRLGSRGNGGESQNNQSDLKRAIIHLSLIQIVERYYTFTCMLELVLEFRNKLMIVEQLIDPIYTKSSRVNLTFTLVILAGRDTPSENSTLTLFRHFYFL